MRLYLAAGLAVLCSGVGLTAPLRYNESSFPIPLGDFPGAGFPNIGTLGIGLNTITGNVNGAPGIGDFAKTRLVSPQHSFESFSVVATRMQVALRYAVSETAAAC